MSQPNQKLTISPPFELNEISLTNQHESPLLRLPAEIRTHIYTLVLSGGTCTVRYLVKNTLHPEKKPYICKRPQRTAHATALLRASRQIYAETRLLLVAATTFSFDRYVYFKDWVQHADKTFKQQVTAIEFPVVAKDMELIDTGCPWGNAPWDPVQQPEWWNAHSLSFDMLPALQSVLIQLFVHRSPREEPGLAQHWAELLRVVDRLNGKGKARVVAEVVSEVSESAPLDSYEKQRMTWRKCDL